MQQLVHADVKERLAVKQSNSVRWKENEVRSQTDTKYHMRSGNERNQAVEMQNKFEKDIHSTTHPNKSYISAHL